VQAKRLKVAIEVDQAIFQPPILTHLLTHSFFPPPPRARGLVYCALAAQQDQAVAGEDDEFWRKGLAEELPTSAEGFAKSPYFALLVRHLLRVLSLPPLVHLVGFGCICVLLQSPFSSYSSVFFLLWKRGER